MNLLIDKCNYVKGEFFMHAKIGEQLYKVLIYEF